MSIPPPVLYVLFVDGPPSSIAVNVSTTIEAVTENSPANNLANYSITCASAGACGSLSTSNEPGAIVYTAPSAIPTGGTVTITATSVAEPAKSASADIAIVPAVPVAITLSEVPASLQVNAAASLSAATVNDTSSDPQVKWAVSCGGAECGSFGATTTASRVATTYTAPAAIPPGNTVTLTATSVTDATKSASANIVITDQTATLANGAYVFATSQLFDVQSLATGVIVVQNGVITGGEQDYINYSTGIYYGADYFFSPITGGSYATTPDGNLQITYTCDGLSYTMVGTVASASKGYVAPLAGSPGVTALALQTRTAAPAGGYVFSVTGIDSTSNPASMGGIINVDSPGQISGAGSILDVVSQNTSDFGNSVSQLQASAVSAPDQYGRVEINLNTGQSPTIPATELIGYIVDAGHIQLISTMSAVNGIGYGGVMNGQALGQGSSTGHFNATSIAGANFVFGAFGIDQNGAMQTAGVFTAKPGGNLSGTLDWNDMAGGRQSSLSFTGSWTIDATGRVTLSKLTDGSGLNTSMHLYLTGDGNGLLLANDSSDSFAGQAFQQNAAPFTAASFSGNYGFNTGGQGEASTFGTVTAVNADESSDSLTGFQDSGNGALDYAISGTLTPASNGIFAGSLAGFNGASADAPKSFEFYLVDNTRAVAIETDNSQLTLGYFELLP